jgi:DNA-directed RNA polymerase subunit RPC12/RpoP
MPSNHTYVCFKCRKTLRRPKTHSAPVICPECREECINLGYKIPIPPKEDDREWRALRESQLALRREQIDSQFQAQVRAKHDLEKRILALEQQPINIGRSGEIRKLKEQLRGGK